MSETKVGHGFDGRGPSLTGRVFSRVANLGGEGCWPWIGATRSKGYGCLYVGGGKSINAHRTVYELLVGPIPDGLVIDHLCRNTSCVRPSHLEPVTDAENILRGVGPTAINARKAHCYRGHILADGNLYRAPSRPRSRNCATCETERGTKRWDRVRREREERLGPPKIPSYRMPRVERPGHRPLRGAENGFSKITREIAAQVKLALTERTCVAVARDLGVPLSTVKDISCGKSWAYVSAEEAK